MAERITGREMKEAQYYRAHTSRMDSDIPSTPTSEATASYTRKDLRRLGLAVEGDYADVSSVTMSKNGESRQIDVTAQRVTRPNGEYRTYFYPSEVLRNSAR